MGVYPQGTYLRVRVNYVNSLRETSIRDVKPYVKIFVEELSSTRKTKHGKYGRDFCDFEWREDFSFSLSGCSLPEKLDIEVKRKGIRSKPTIASAKIFLRHLITQPAISVTETLFDAVGYIRGTIALDIWLMGPTIPSFGTLATVEPWSPRAESMPSTPPGYSENEINRELTMTYSLSGSSSLTPSETPTRVSNNSQYSIGNQQERVYGQIYYPLNQVSPRLSQSNTLSQQDSLPVTVATRQATLMSRVYSAPASAPRYRQIHDEGINDYKHPHGK